MDLIIVSGRSGAGKSVVLSQLEDEGYYCVDNAPISLLETFMDHAAQAGVEQVALSIDIRNTLLQRDDEELIAVIKKLKEKHHTSILFLDCESKVLIARYGNTRRVHPLMLKQKLSLEQAIEQENLALEFLRSRADFIINTSNLNIYDLMDRVNEFLLLIQRVRPLRVIFYSFGFKYGMPPSSNVVFDVRHLPNPFWDKSIASYTGRDKPVQDFFARHGEVAQEIELMQHYLTPLLEKVAANSSRQFIVISVGCTGGKHRSVYCAEALAKYYAEQGYLTQCHHQTLKLTTTFCCDERGCEIIVDDVTLNVPKDEVVEDKPASQLSDKPAKAWASQIDKRTLLCQKPQQSWGFELVHLSLYRKLETGNSLKHNFSTSYQRRRISCPKATKIGWLPRS